MTDKWFEIFRAGTYPQGEFSESDLAAIAAHYDPRVHEAPIVLGHPKTDSPAYGWVKAVQAEGGALKAQFGDFHEELPDLVRSGAYRKRSAAFWKGPDGWHLRHVGFLGAVPPQIKGLKNIQFAERDYIEIEWPVDSVQEVSMSEMSEKRAESGVEASTLVEKIAALEANMARLQADKETAEKNAAQFAEKERVASAKLRRQEVESRLNKLQEAGRLTPAERSTGLAEFLSTCDESTEVEFAEGKKETVPAFMWRFLESRPSVVEMRELAGKKETSDPPVPAEFAEADPERLELYKKAKAYQRVSNNVTFAEALAHIAAE